MNNAQFTRYAYLGIAAVTLVGIAGFFSGIRSQKYTLAYSSVLGASMAITLTPVVAISQSLIRRKLSELEESKEEAERAYNLGYESAMTVASHDNKLAFAEWESELLKSHRQELEQLVNDWSEKTANVQAVEQEKRTKLEGLIQSKNEELLQLQGELDEIPELRYQITRLEKRIARYQEDLDEFNEQRSRLKDYSLELEKRENNLKSLHAQIRTENDGLTQMKLDLAHQQASYQVLQKDLMDKEQAIAKLRASIEYKTEEAIEQMEQQYQAGFEGGYSQANSQWSVEREKLLLQVDRLTIQLGEKKAKEALEKRLPELVEVLKDERKPFLIVGSQGSGKALASAAIAQSYAGNAGLLPFVLDISEGGSDDSTWHKLGIPNTADARLFLQWMKSVVGQLDPDKDSLPFRNRPDRYNQSPAIVLIIDELMTCLDGLDKSEYEEFVNCLKAFETRGNKRKVFVGLLTQNEQIQNLNKVTNTGRLSNFYKVFLNDGLTSKCSKEMLDKSEDLRDYIEVYRDNYKCAVLYNNAKGEVMRPCKHPSHWGNKIKETVPSRVVEIQLHKPYDWYPTEVVKLFQKYLPDE